MHFLLFFLLRWKILELIMTWWPWKWHFRCIQSLHSDDAQVILAHYRGSRKDWDQQWWPAIALCVDLCPDAACWRYKQHVTKSLTGMGYKFHFLQKHGYRCKLLLIINKPVENRKVAFLTKNILSARRGKNFCVGAVFLVWEYLVAFFWFEIYWSSFLVRGILFGGFLLGVYWWWSQWSFRDHDPAMKRTRLCIWSFR